MPSKFCNSKEYTNSYITTADWGKYLCLSLAIYLTFFVNYIVVKLRWIYYTHRTFQFMSFEWKFVGKSYVTNQTNSKFLVYFKFMKQRTLNAILPLGYSLDKIFYNQFFDRIVYKFSVPVCVNMICVKCPTL